MADRPIIFSAPMVRALLDGRKTQTRRLLSQARVFATPESSAFTLSGGDMIRALQGASDFRHLHETGWFWEADAFEWQAPATRTGWMAHIGYAAGDRLYVREHWKTPLAYEDLAPSELGGEEAVMYLADGHIDMLGRGDRTTLFGRHRQGMHMPRWASRLTLIVDEVRIQRLNDLTEEEAIAEGVAEHPVKGFWVPGVEHASKDFPLLSRATGRGMFAALWDTLHGSGEWLANPVVVALTFRVERGNIDNLGGDA